MKRLRSCVLSFVLILGMTLSAASAGEEQYYYETTEKRSDGIIDTNNGAYDSFVIGKNGTGYIYSTKEYMYRSEMSDSITIFNAEEMKVVKDVAYIDTVNQQLADSTMKLQAVYEGLVGAGDILYLAAAIGSDSAIRSEAIIITVRPNGDVSVIQPGISLLDTSSAVILSMNVNGDLLLTFSNQMCSIKIDGTVNWEIESGEPEYYNTLGILAKTGRTIIIGRNNSAYCFNGIEKEQDWLRGTASFDLATGETKWISRFAGNRPYMDGGSFGIDEKGTFFYVGNDLISSPEYAKRNPSMVIPTREDFASDSEYQDYIASIYAGVVLPEGSWKLTCPLIAVDADGNFKWIVNSELYGNDEYSIRYSNGLLYTFGQIFYEPNRHEISIEPYEASYKSGCIVRDAATGEEVRRYYFSDNVEDVDGDIFDFVTDACVLADGTIIYASFIGNLYIVSSDGSSCTRSDLAGEKNFKVYDSKVYYQVKDTESTNDIAWINLTESVADGYACTNGAAGDQNRYPEDVKITFDKVRLDNGDQVTVAFKVSEDVEQSVLGDTGVVLSATIMSGDEEVKKLELTYQEDGQWQGSTSFSLDEGDYTLRAFVGSAAFETVDNCEFTVIESVTGQDIPSINVPGDDTEDEENPDLDDQPKTSDTFMGYWLLLIGVFVGCAGFSARRRWNKIQ